jgi:hypothetical protein
MLHAIITSRISLPQAQYLALHSIFIRSLPLIATTTFTMPSAATNTAIPHHGIPALSKVVPSKHSLGVNFDISRTQEESPP